MLIRRGLRILSFKKEHYRLKIDLHIHTVHSDGYGTVREILKIGKAKSLDGLAITDHGVLQGYFEAKSYNCNLLILPGYEICTDAGHILVIGIEELPPRVECIRYESLIKWVKDHGGLTVLAHPAIGRIRYDKWMKFKPDAIEVLNSSYPLSKFFIKRSLRIAGRLNVPGVAGSDAHYIQCIGDSYTVVETDNLSSESIIEAIKNGRVDFRGGLSPIKTRFRIGMGYMLSVLKNFSLMQL